MGGMRALLIVLLVSILCACAGAQGDAAVGERVLHWDELRDGIDPYVMQVESGIVLADEGQWEAWAATLPESMAVPQVESIKAVDVDDAVLVVVSYRGCEPGSELRHAGSGALEHRLLEDGSVACEAERQVVEVWQVPLDELDVGRHDVVLLEG